MSDSPRILGFIGRVKIDRQIIATTTVIEVPQANADELKRARPKQVCDLTPDTRLNPYGVYVPRRIFK